jgi:hypothetical protein
MPRYEAPPIFRNQSTLSEESMPIAVKAYANADDVLLAWEPNPWSNDWVGFQVERRDNNSQQVTVLVNRIPAQASQGPVQETGAASGPTFARCRPTACPIASPA